jgi:hypothetical protein
VVTLRQVLEQFEHQSGTLSLGQMATALGVERPILQDMIDYWVRKGRLREVVDCACPSGSCSSGCPFIMAMPRSYEYVTEAETKACSRCG